MYLVIICIITASLVTGCGSTGSNNTTTAVAGNSEQGQTTVAAPKPLTIMTKDNYYAPKSYSQDLPVWQEVEKATNTKTTWIVASEGYDEMVKIKFASGDKLPDLVWGTQDYDKYGTQGLVVDWKELIEKYKPQNIIKHLETYPIVQAVVTNVDDGKMYALRNGQPSKYIWNWGLLIREDWLKKLNLQAPKTTDEFVEVMKRFRDADLNGSGKPDEYLNFAGNTLTSLYFMANQFDLHTLYSDGFYISDGKIVNEWVSDNFKNFLIYMNMLYKENILNPEALTATEEKWQTTLAQNKSGAESFFLHEYGTLNSKLQKASGISDASFMGLETLKGPSGHQMVEVELAIDNPTVITKDADKELAIKFVDFLYSDKGSELVSWGLEGKTFTKQNGENVFTDEVMNNPDKLSMEEVLRSYGAMWNFARNWSESKQAFDWTSPKAKYSILNTKYYNVAAPFAFYLSYKKDDQDILNKYKTDFATFRDENVIKFITGEKDISEFDDFKKGLENVGANEITQVYQRRYEGIKDQIGSLYK